MLQDLRAASQQVNAANKALEAAQQALSEYEQTPDGRAEQWLLDHNIDVDPARDGEGMPIPGNYVVSTGEILALADCMTDLPADEPEALAGTSADLPWGGKHAEERRQRLERGERA